MDGGTPPLVVAHRGASSLVAEHTLEAYITALATGADAVECDVRLTRDGHLVCVHDRTVNRTSNGRGVVSELDLQGLQQLDFASWHGRWPESADDLLADEPYLAGVEPDRRADGRVLTLDALLALVRDADRPVQLLVETKHPTRYGGLVEKELVRTLARFGWAGRPAPVNPPRRRRAAASTGRVTIMSFAAVALRRVRLLAPDVPTVLLMDRLNPARRDGALPSGVGIAGPGLHVVAEHPGYVQRAHRRGHRVYVWTVDAPLDVDFVLDLGADAVITNEPAAVRSRIAERV